MTFQEIIFSLQQFWSSKGCIIGNPYDIEKGAGTFNPNTFLMSLGPEPWNVAYVEPSRRPKDGRYGDNPNRVYQHHQFQVIMKPSPTNIQELYLESLRVLGIEPEKHDIRFVEDDWESPTLGAWGLGWEVWLDGMEITQFTYFQQVGGLELDVIPVEITYGLERLALYIQNKENVYDLEWTKGVKYGDMRYQFEFENSKYSFELATLDKHFKWFDEYEEEAKKIGKVDFLVQGTIYPDVVESGLGGESVVIKSHHNVGGLPEHVEFNEIIEPLRDLFKDEVRKAGLELGIPEKLVFRQPFPGPGLGIRIIGEVTEEKVKIVQDADAIYREEISNAGLDRSIGQYFAALTNMRSVGVMGDERTYDYAVVLRAVNTIDFMTAEAASIPYEVLQKVTSRIINEVGHVNRVLYDITSKPPGTIELE